MIKVMDKVLYGLGIRRWQPIVKVDSWSIIRHRAVTLAAVGPCTKLIDRPGELLRNGACVWNNDGSRRSFVRFMSVTMNC